MKIHLKYLRTILTIRIIDVGTFFTFLVHVDFNTRIYLVDFYLVLFRI